MSSPNIKAPHWVAAQANPWTTVDLALDRLDNSANAAATFTFPSDANATLTTETYQTAGLITIAGTLSAARVLSLPKTAGSPATTIARVLAFRNATTQAVTLRSTVPAVPAVDVTLAAGAVAIVHCDGTDVIDLTGLEALQLGNRSHDVPFGFAAAPTASELLLDIVPGRAIRTPASGWCVGQGDTNPAASFVMDVTVNGGAAGTVTISTAGAISVSAGPISVAAGARLKVTAPVAPDASVAGWALTLIADAD